MKILVISQYFWPENFRVNDFCFGLIEKGHDVTVLTGKPNYPGGKFYKGYNFFKINFECINNVNIYRVGIFPRGRGSKLNLLLNYISFSFFACLRLFFFKSNFDRIIVYQLSPATIGFPALLAKIKFKAPIFFYIQDLWPESLSDAGGIKNKLFLNVVNQMMNLFYSNSSQIWVQSQGFIDYLLGKGVPLNKIRYLPNTVESFYYPHKIEEKYKTKFPNGFNIVFAGNIGVAQDFVTIIKAAEILNKKKLPVNWVILGEGRELFKIQKLISELNLSHKFYFLGSFPSNEMPFYFACADALLVSLKKSFIFSLTIPSKLQSYLACGKPIIANMDGVGANIINESNSGLCSTSGNYIDLAKNVEIMYRKNIFEREIYSKNAYNYFLNHFERKIIIDKIENYLTNL